MLNQLIARKARGTNASKIISGERSVENNWILHRSAQPIIEKAAAAAAEWNKAVSLFMFCFISSTCLERAIITIAGTTSHPTKVLYFFFPSLVFLCCLSVQCVESSKKTSWQITPGIVWLAATHLNIRMIYSWFDCYIFIIFIIGVYCICVVCWSSVMF